MQATLKFITLQAEQSTGGRCTAPRDAAVLMVDPSPRQIQKDRGKGNKQHNPNSVKFPSIPEFKKKIEAHQLKLI